MKNSRIVTLTGPGGIGKTRLAVEIGARLLNSYTDGVWIVDFAGVENASLAPSTVASVFGLREGSNQDFIQVISTFLQAQEMLLILDNCEHLATACGELCQKLLQCCPRLSVLVTSQVPLSIVGEVLYPLRPLSYPIVKLAANEDVKQYDAVQLFLDRAMRLSPSFTFDETTLKSVVRICQHLEGIPLAIELAAGWVRALSVAEIATQIDAQLGSRLELLSVNITAAHNRPKPLRTTLEWSYNLLSSDEKMLLNRLSVFVDGWSLEGAIEVCQGEGIRKHDILPMLAKMVEKSLVIANVQDEQTRYKLLKTVEIFAFEKLVASGELTAVYRKRQEWFITLCCQASQQMEGPNEVEYLQLLETEHENIRGVLRYSLNQNVGNALRIAEAIVRFWLIRGFLTEGQQWFLQILEANKNASPLFRAGCLVNLTNLACEQSQFTKAATLAEEALSLFEQHLDPVKHEVGKASLLNVLGLIYDSFQNYSAARLSFEQAALIARKPNNIALLGTVLANLANTARKQGDLDAARGFLQESRDIAEARKDRKALAIVLNGLGIIAEKFDKDWQGAMTIYQQSFALFSELGDKKGMANVMQNIALMPSGPAAYEIDNSLFSDSLQLYTEIEDARSSARLLLNKAYKIMQQGQTAEAQRLLKEAIVICSPLNYNDVIIDCLEQLATLYLICSKPQRALELFSFTRKAYQETDPKIKWEEQNGYDEILKRLQAELGEEFGKITEAGLALTLPGAVKLVIEDNEILFTPDDTLNLNDK